MTSAPVLPKKPSAIAVLRETVTSQAVELGAARESIAQLKLSIEDRGWSMSGNDRSLEGLDLESLKTLSEELRTWIIAGGIMKRIAELRGEYIYGDGVGFKGIPKHKRKLFYENENNISKLFSATALQEVNRAHATDGPVVFLVKKSSYEILRVPFEQLADMNLDPDDPERIWHVRRTFTRTTSANSTGAVYDKFIPAITCPANEAKKSSVNVGGGQNVAVDHDWVAIVWSVNAQVGQPLGVPDLFASLQWAEKYTSYLKNQGRFAEALAMLAWQFKAAKTEDAKRLAATVANGGKAASAAGTPDLEAKPLPGGGNVSFDNGAPLAGQAAAAASVPLNSVLSTSKTDTGSNLNADLVRMVNSRRAEATVFFEAIGRAMGIPKLVVVWPDIEVESPFREAQMLMAANDTGLFAPDEVRSAIGDKLRIVLKAGSSVPDGYLQPNNAKSLPRKDIDTDAETPAPSTGANNKQGKDALGVGKLNDSKGQNAARNKGEV